ncbi:MAG: MiaB/RimO family radical SAM methylthiotransferase [Elusimicrobia bacterium]|nr:MiaB/RimO family radical SAM methylthiotransferase [Elusimicrobiota bacterium]
MKLHVITLGCQMSAADGAETAADLGRRGWQAAAVPAPADTIFLTTCSVRRHAEQRALSLIGRLREWKAQDPSRFLVVAGCVAERLGERLARRFPHVDLVVGSKRAGSYADIVAQAVAVRNSESPQAIRNPAAPPRGAAVPSGGKPVQHLTIMRGCSCSCSYCIVPTVRGPESCRPAEEILGEARARIEDGARELILLGQRVNAYRSGAADFPDLLRALDALPGLRRLRFMSPHPALCDDRFSSAVRECRTVCEWVHLPAQSGCDRLLGLMRRGYSREQFLRTADRLRQTLPGVVVSTDIIVGFPSETDTDFAQTLTLIEELRPASAFCFKYSAREGTAAAALADDVPAPVKEGRLAAVNAAVERLTTQALHAQVGSSVEVLAETPTFGRTRTGFKARWRSPVAAGDLVSIRVDAATRRTLLGDIHEPHNP